MKQIILFTLVFIFIISCNTNKSQETVVLANYESGKVHKEVIDSKWFEYYPSGRLMTVIPLKNKNFDGIGYSFYENGDTLAIKNYKDNELNGTTIRFHKSGNISAKESYTNSLLDGKAFYYNQSEQLLYERNYLLGKKRGWNYDYYLNGNFKFKVYHILPEKEEYVVKEYEYDSISQKKKINRRVSYFIRDTIDTSNPIAELKYCCRNNDSIALVTGKIDVYHNILDSTKTVLGRYDYERESFFVEFSNKVGIDTLRGFIFNYKTDKKGQRTGTQTPIENIIYKK
ncbi:hypothetical protein WAF17_06080 [Bernardetia sp. ABR2-2B]|uniref:toxin-antitoxin system YwqK family antitoxin n=1 Tax=Bernardetia sp. ABR2-2B TaxID=3127472 RepID=UPI0030CD2016